MDSSHFHARCTYRGRPPRALIFAALESGNEKLTTLSLEISISKFSPSKTLPKIGVFHIFMKYKNYPNIFRNQIFSEIAKRNQTKHGVTRCVGSLKCQVSFAKELYLQKSSIYMQKSSIYKILYMYTEI